MLFMGVLRDKVMLFLDTWDGAGVRTSQIASEMDMIKFKVVVWRVGETKKYNNMSDAELVPDIRLADNDPMALHFHN